MKEEVKFETLKNLDGHLVRVEGTIIDMLNLEVFTAFNSPNPQDNESFNFFTDYYGSLMEGYLNPEDFVYHERTVAVVRVNKIPFERPKNCISLPHLYNLTDDELKANVEREDTILPVFIKAYCNSDNTLLIGKTVEVIGFFNIQATQSEAPEVNPNDMQTELDKILNPKFSPIVHAIRIRPTTVYEIIPKGMESFAPNQFIFEKFRQIFLKACLGDQTLAQFTMYSLVSTITNRPHGIPIDIIPLNIYNVLSNKLTSNIQGLFNLFSPHSVHLPISLNKFGSSKLYGKKNYDLNCIEQGLYLPEGSTLILDETNLETGTLGEVGVKNATFINQILQNQKFYFDFDYCNFEALSNCNVIGISRGKSIFEFDYRVVYRNS